MTIDVLASVRQRGGVPRQLRVEYPGAVYHLMNRGDRQEPIFVDDRDRELFMETLGEARAKTGWQVRKGVAISQLFN